jgi:hypothetical protein
MKDIMNGRIIHMGKKRIASDIPVVKILQGGSRRKKLSFAGARKRNAGGLIKSPLTSCPPKASTIF